MGDAGPDRLPELETLCECCRGRGTRRDAGEDVRCALCNGAGYEPTPFGERVLALLRHNLKGFKGPVEWRN